MNIQEAQALVPEGWEIIKFDYSGVCTFKRASCILRRDHYGYWSCTVRVKDAADTESAHSYGTAKEAIEDARHILEYRREKLWEALRECK